MAVIARTINPYASDRLQYAMEESAVGYRGMTQRTRHTGLSASATLRSALDFRKPWFILATTPLLALWVFVFWGGWHPLDALWFSAGAIGTALVWSSQGWEPWNMALNRVTRGRAQRPNEYSLIQQITADFFAMPRLKQIQAAWIGAGALIPWLISGASLLIGARPFRVWPEPMQWWVMVILGIGEAIRGRAIALYVLAGLLQRNWPQLLQRVGVADTEPSIPNPRRIHDVR